MNTLEFIVNKFKLNLLAHSPIKIRYLSREEFAQLLCTVGYRVGVEVGVKEGNFSKCLCINNPDLHLTSVDPYSMETNNGNFDSQEIADAMYRKACKNLKGYNCDLVRKTSAEASRDFADGSLDFVYIDGNHMYDYVFEDLSVWYPKVRVGGIMSGHDYLLRNPSCQVTEAVDDFMKQNSITPIIMFGSHMPERIKSWMWVKE